MSAAENAPLKTAQEIKKLGASFRDPSGFLFDRAGGLYRQVNQVYRPHFDRLIESGLYQELVDDRLLIPHQQVDLEPPLPSIAYKVIQPEKVGFISYPYEWCFSQLKSAALATLEIQKRAMRRGMSLKDASAYNIQFHRGKPLLIDSLSFEKLPEGKPWIAYRQFCQHFLAPLAVAAYRDVRLTQLLRIYIDGIPLDLASKILPTRTRFNLPILLHIHMHAASQQRYASQKIDTSQRVGQNALLGIIENLEGGIRALKWNASGTAWGNYYEQEHNYTNAGLEHKQQIIAGWVERIQPLSVWDLGANTGMFSRLASERGIPTIAWDIDPGTVEHNYLESKRLAETNLLPLVLDLTNPSPAIGWNNRERASFQERGPAGMALALALIHHLAIGNNVPLASLAEFLHDLAPWSVIEFIPKEDTQAKRLLANREDIFSEYTQENFTQVFSQYFTIHDTQSIQDSSRILFLMQSRAV